MNRAASVFHIHLKLFLRDRGMLVFYLAGVFVSGVAVPFFSHSLVTSFTMAAFITTMFLKPLLGESLAGEREKKTLESLLSTAVTGKSVLLGKLFFYLLFAAALFGASALCAALTCRFAGYASEFAPWQWLCVMGMAAMNFAAIAVSGSYLSATSADLRTANGRVSVAAYPLGLLFIIFITVVSLNQPIAALAAGGVAAALYLCISAVFGVKASRMKQQNYYENIKIKKERRAHAGGADYAVPKSQLAIVLRHELRYLMAIKSQTRLFILLCAATAGCAWTSKLIGRDTLGLGYFDLTVLLLLFGVPSAVRNMAAYSIGGERAYKTGESLLSTSLRVKAIFLAKCATPILVALAMIAATSLLVLTGVNVIGRFLGSATAELFSPVQFTLLIPGGIMACVAMILLSGIFSVLMKTPRGGLYVSTLLQLVLFAPPAMIVYLAPANSFMWAVVYAGALVLMNAVLLACMSGNICRPWLMGRL